MGLQYNILMEDLSVTAASTLILVRPAAAVGFVVLRAWASQAGGATSAQVKIQLGRKAGSGGLPTGLTSVTPKKLHERYPASVFVGGTSGAAGTCGVNSSTEGGGTFDPTYQDAFNNLNGWLWTPVFEREFVFIAGSADACVLRFPATPSPTSNWSAGLCIEEL